MTDERKTDFKAVARLVGVGHRCLGDALSEIQIRKIANAGFAIGAIGVAESSVRFACNMLRAAAGEPPLAKGKT